MCCLPTIQNTISLIKVYNVTAYHVLRELEHGFHCASFIWYHWFLFGFDVEKLTARASEKSTNTNCLKKYLTWTLGAAEQLRVFFKPNMSFLFWAITEYWLLIRIWKVNFCRSFCSPNRRITHLTLLPKTRTRFCVATDCVISWIVLNPYCDITNITKKQKCCNIPQRVDPTALNLWFQAFFCIKPVALHSNYIEKHEIKKNDFQRNEPSFQNADR